MIPLTPLLAWALMTPAASYSSAGFFDQEASQGGGGGYTFTGSPRSHGMTCATCHRGGDSGFGVLLFSTPGGLFDTGYEPGVAYDVQVALLDERAGRDRNGACAPGLAGCNRNSFAAELVGADGRAAGLLCPDGDHLSGPDCETRSASETTLTDDGAIVGRSLAVPPLCQPGVELDRPCVDLPALRDAGWTQAQIDTFIASEVRGAYRWTFRWRAPATGSEPVELFLGVVDGDGGTRLDPVFADYQGDGAVMRRLTLPRRGQGRATSGSGCATGGHPLASGLVLLAAAALLMVRRRTPGVVALAVTLAIATSWSFPALAQTSCDIVTGASCGWGEGCDCDHDGYVRASNEAKKYCHYSRCPLDGDDRDAAVLGIPSVHNHDGDGFTADYDCDDENACIDRDCNNVCGGTLTPSAPPSVETGGDAGPGDVIGADTSRIGAWIDDPARTPSGVLNENRTPRGEPPMPGCSGAGGTGPASGLALVLAFVWLLLRARRRSAVLAATIVALAALQAGCAATRPWERGQLAKAPMRFVADGLEAQLEQHVLQYREGAAGGFGGGGGGCGCN